LEANPIILDDQVDGIWCILKAYIDVGCSGMLAHISQGLLDDTDQVVNLFC
jgi:hypothetical protein